MTVTKQRARRPKKEDKMAATDAPAPEAVEGSAEATEPKEPRPETTFRVLTRPSGEQLWKVHDETVDGRTQDEGKKRAARMLGEDPDYKAMIEGAGIELAVTSARSFKPQLVKVEPQPAKVVIR